MTISELTSSQWLDLGLSALLVIATAILGRWVINVVLNRLIGRLASRTRTGLDNLLIETTGPALYYYAIVFALENAANRLQFISWPDYLPSIFFVLYFLVVLLFTWRLTAGLFEWYWKEVAPQTDSKLDEQLLPFFRRVALILIGLIGLIIFLARFDVDVSALVTTLGIGSLAIALAAQTTLGDTLAGFVIMMDRPYRIGDRIELQDLDTWGDVVDIGLRSTRIRTRDNRMVIVPNSVIGKSLIINYAYPDSHYRIQIHIGVAYGSDIEQVRMLMVKAVEGVEGVSQEHPVEALFLEFGDSALIFRVRWWLDSYADTRRMFDQVNTALYAALNEHGVELPYPQREVHHRIGPEEADRLEGWFKPQGT